MKQQEREYAAIDAHQAAKRKKHEARTSDRMSRMMTPKGRVPVSAQRVDPLELREVHVTSKKHEEKMQHEEDARMKIEEDLYGARQARQTAHRKRKAQEAAAPAEPKRTRFEEETRERIKDVEALVTKYEKQQEKQKAPEISKRTLSRTGSDRALKRQRNIAIANEMMGPTGPHNIARVVAANPGQPLSGAIPRPWAGGRSASRKASVRRRDFPGRCGTRGTESTRRLHAEGSAAAAAPRREDAGRATEEHAGRRGFGAESKAPRIAPHRGGKNQTDGGGRTGSAGTDTRLAHNRADGRGPVSGAYSAARNRAPVAAHCRTGTCTAQRDAATHRHRGRRRRSQPHENITEAVAAGASEHARTEQQTLRLHRLRFPARRHRRVDSNAVETGDAPLHQHR